MCPTLYDEDHEVGLRLAVSHDKPVDHNTSMNAVSERTHALPNSTADIWAD